MTQQKPYLKFALSDKQYVLEYLEHKNLNANNFYYYEKLKRWMLSFKKDDKLSILIELNNMDQELSRYLKAICTFDINTIKSFGDCTFEDIHLVHCKIIDDICKL